MVCFAFLVLSCLMLLYPGTQSLSLDCKVYDLLPWSYHQLKNGPEAWGDSFQHCKDKNQSPVSIMDKNVITDKSLKPLTLTNYDRVLNAASIENNGNTVIVTPTDGVERTFELDGTKYVLKLFYFHWGSTDKQGSEHNINNNKYPLEVQFLHMSGDGKYAILASVFRIQKADNEAFSPIAEKLPLIKYEKSSTNLTNYIELLKFFSKPEPAYYKYTGSATVPPCTEGVTWLVTIGAAKIGGDQLKKLRGLQSVEKDNESKQCALMDNFRPVQLLNGREIRRPA